MLNWNAMRSRGFAWRNLFTLDDQPITLDDQNITLE